MITKCPHCNAKFKARDDLKGKKTKCPKCKQSFAIDEIETRPVLPSGKTGVDKREVEFCARCSREIRQTEQGYVFKSVVVCAECDKKLRSCSELGSDQTSTVMTEVDAPVQQADVMQAKETDLCFFCGRESATKKSGHLVPMCQVVRTEGSDALRTAAIVALGGGGRRFHAW